VITQYPYIMTRGITPDTALTAPYAAGAVEGNHHSKRPYAPSEEDEALAGVECPEQ